MSAVSYAAALARFALKRPVTICMLSVSLLLLGLISSRLLPLEKFPGIEIPEIVVYTPYPNSSPAEVERLITRPLEESLSTLSGIKEMQSSSTTDASRIEIEFDWDASINAKSIDAREKIDAVKHLLPADIGRVLVVQFNTNDMPVFQLRISSQRDLSDAYDLLDRSLKKPLERVDGVSQVTLYGVEKRQIMIRLDSKALLQHHLDPETVLAQLRSQNFAINGGYVRTSSEKILLNPVGEYRSVNEIKQLPVAPHLVLSDIASIGFESPKQVEGRHLNRTYAIGMDVFKESSANLVDVAERAMQVVKEVGNDPAFQGVNLFVMQNTADDVKSSLNDLLNAGLVGALLSFAVLYLFLRNWATTLMVVISVPISLFITMGFMYAFGYSLNILSLMGLMLAVGMLVDNAVVVTESIQHERENGLTGEEATLSGTGKVAMAVIAGTLTTAIVFLPNIVGEKIDVTIFLEHVAVAICISLLASLIISQTLIPYLATRFAKYMGPKSGKKQKTVADRSTPTRYQRLLKWCIGHPRWTSFCALLLLASIAVPMSMVSGDQNNGAFNNRLFINYFLHSEYPITEVEQEVSRMEDYLFEHQQEFGFESVYSYYQSGQASTTVILPKDYRGDVNQLMEKIRKGFPDFVLSDPQFGWNQQNGGVRITLSGSSTDVLKDLSEQLVQSLSRVPGLTDVRSELADAQKELQVRIDRERALAAGLSTSEVAEAISLALRSVRLRSYRADENGEILLYVGFEHAYQESLDKLKLLPITQQGNRVVTLQQVADIRLAPRLGEIRRYDRQTAIAVGANLNDITLDEARERIGNALQNWQLPAGYHWSYDGSFRHQEEAENIMQVNMLLAVCMIYIVMAALFESILLPTAVLSSLFLSIVGVFWALLISGQPISIMAMIGILILMGIVVNNGIVLVDYINQLVNNGRHLEDAVIEGCQSRLRPILMTVATTVLGLVPLALGHTQIGGDGPPYAPMAIAIIGGLVFSTITSLVVVPHFYVRLLVWRHQFALMRQRLKAKLERYKLLQRPQ
ncbi:AcrB/AcrD/AcrF family protein [Idiomarina tyrosinivorans]|uniref:AcrB/AcrD/AcrF family protein n=1 Tax=Idiomarina tyrosinivorans TaxID=1445662 RepID=A0A432ZUK9_9GAMM|nr:efflux RND transporter permease subunit [Idiomarina tyrosinivorans]RUO81498.1 AcrB/AcrD/AcrF family protein [Idiomarina tyrosinivorans]